MNQRLRVNLMLAFLLGFVFISASFVGLPADFNADHLEDIESIESLSYFDFLKLILNPLTPAWFYPPDTPQMGYLRPLQFILLKAYYDWFGYGMASFHLTAAVGFGLLNAVFFFLVSTFTRSLFYGWLTVILYVSFPSNFSLIASIYSLDFQFFVSIFSIAALTIFGILSFTDWKKTASFWLVLLGWVVVVWLGIKLKSTEKIIPFICLGFLIFRSRFILSRLGRMRLVILIASILSTMVLVVPLRPFEEWIKEGGRVAKQVSFEPATKKDSVTLSFSPKNLIQRTFFIPGGEFPFTTVHRRNVPGSFTENHGFFLGWLFWLGILLAPLILTRLRRRLGEARCHGYWLALVWFLAIIAGFGSGSGVQDKRLLNFAFVPSVLLLFGTTGMMETAFFRRHAKILIWRWALIVAVLYTGITNLGFYSKLLIHFGGMQDAVVRAERDVYRSVYGEERNPLDLHRHHQELQENFLIIDWYDLPENWFEVAQGKLKKQKRVFFYARTPDSERLQRLREAGYKVMLWKRYSFFEAKPLVFRFSNLIERFKSLYKERKKREIIVYLIEES